MGSDIRILIQADEEPHDLMVPMNWRIEPIGDYWKQCVPEATHIIDGQGRCYWPGYECGEWPAICAALMELHACRSVKKLWYGGDDQDDMPECPPERVLEISKYYMEHGNRPWEGY